MSSNALPRIILMLKYPQPGLVKTRLVPALGEQRACELYRALVRHTLREVERFTAHERVSIQVRIAGAPDCEIARQWLGAEMLFAPQGDGDLGQRMERAVQEAFEKGGPAAIVIGADCPELAAGHLAAALRVLERKDVVLGPAADGGYYLIGMRRLLPEPFRGIEWGSERVLDQTLAALRQARVECELLDTLHDIDRAEDLPFWAETNSAKAMGSGKVSVIVPALNEAAHLPATLEAAQRGQPHEIIVVDGGSADDTAKIARSLDCIVLSGPRCRARQMNVGAAAATGEYLLFLHADTLLPADYATHVSEVLAQSEAVGGAFMFATSDDFAGRKLVERATNWRTRLWQFPYGDQGLFLRRDTFKQIGGFSDMPIMEDYEFVRRLRRLGKIAIAPAPAITSGRRWQRLGVLRTTLTNRAIILAYHLGISPSRLAGWYRGRRSERDSLTRARVDPEPIRSAVNCIGPLK
jgi:rSAM/selenodomain-associated transferase 2/rSAM/selenodomain-associated transferase 1